MSDRTDPLTIWIVDPISYSGMAYYDAGLAGGLANAGADVTLVGSVRPLIVPAARHGSRVQPILNGIDPDRPRWRRALGYAFSMVRLWRRIRRQRPDWLLWNYIEQPRLDRMVISRALAAGVKVGFVAHEVEPWEGDESRSATYRWLIEEAADAVIVHGSENERLLQGRWDIPAERVIVSEHGDYREWVDAGADQRAARVRLGLPVEAPIALFFGTLRMSKGLGTLLAAWPTVREAVPDAGLVIAGRPYRGTDPTALEGLGPGVSLRAGAVSPEDTNDYYAAADVVAIPYDKVSTSGVLRYAYSAGRAVVASDTGELSVHVLPGETGWLVPPGDSGSTARALAEALSDRGLAATMGSAARAYTDREFDWAAVARRLSARLAAMAEAQDESSSP